MGDPAVPVVPDNRAWGSGARRTTGRQLLQGAWTAGTPRRATPRFSGSSDGTRAGCPRPCRDFDGIGPAAWRPHSWAGLAFAEAVAGDRGQAKAHARGGGQQRFRDALRPSMAGLHVSMGRRRGRTGRRRRRGHPVQQAQALERAVRHWRADARTRRQSRPRAPRGTAGTPMPPSGISPAPGGFTKQCAHRSTSPKPGCTGAGC